MSINFAPLMQKVSSIASEISAVHDAIAYTNMAAGFLGGSSPSTTPTPCTPVTPPSTSTSSSASAGPTLVITHEMNKVNGTGVTITVQNDAGQITQTIHIDGTTITTTVKSATSTS